MSAKMDALAFAVLAITCTAQIESQSASSAPPTPDHVVIVIEENKRSSQIYGSASAPYINSLAPQGAKFTKSFGVTHPSQPNYLHFFSGSGQGVTNDTTPPPGSPYSTPNLASELIAAGKTFGGYSEDLPSVGYTGSSSGYYVRKHNPWVDFSNVPSSVNMPFTMFPSDYTQLPTVSIVIPNMVNDMHDGTVQQGDTWLKNKLDAYVTWAKTHNSLLIVTWDEDDYSSNNNVATIFVGQMVKQGVYSETINHYTILRMIEEMYSLPHAGAAANAASITDCWTTSTTVSSYTFTLNISPSTGNKVNVNPPGQDYSASTQAISETAGSTVILTAAAASGQAFQSWSDGTTANPKTITMNSAVTLTANFAPVTVNYTLTLNISPASGNTVTVNPPGNTYSASTQNITEASGSSVTLTATAASGQSFQGWSDGVTTNPRAIAMTSDIALAANFTTSPTTYTLTVEISPSDGNTVTVSPPGTAYSSPTQAIVESAGTSITLTATPASGKVFQYWGDGTTANPKTLVMNSDVTMTANFATAPTTYTLTLNISPANGNSVTVSPPGTTYSASTQNISENSGTTTTLTAMPASGQVFQSWSDGSTTNPKTVTISSNTSLTANFASAPTLAAASTKLVKASYSQYARSGPGSSYSAVGVVYSGQTYVSIGTTSGWYKIWYNGAAAYIYTGYAVTTSGNVASVDGTGQYVYNSSGYKAGVIYQGQIYSLISSSSYTSGWNKIYFKGGTYYAQSATMTEYYLN